MKGINPSFIERLMEAMGSSITNMEGAESNA